MTYHLLISAQAMEDIKFHKKSGNKIVLKKIAVLLNEIVEKKKFEGTGKPEQLKMQFIRFVVKKNKFRTQASVFCRFHSGRINKRSLRK